MIERDVKGAVHGVDIQAEHLTEDAAVHGTTKDQEAEKEDEAGMCVCEFSYNFPKCKKSQGELVCQPGSRHCFVSFSSSILLVLRISSHCLFTVFCQVLEVDDTIVV